MKSRCAMLPPSGFNFLVHPPALVPRSKLPSSHAFTGENDKGFSDIEVSDAQFDAFVARHAHLAEKGVVMAPEDNNAMTTSYIMITPG